jgi:sec-independent protein translocase protein TatB
MGAEMIFIFLLALIIFGPKRLPQLAREVGKFVGEFKRASNDFKSQLQAEIEKAGVEPVARRSPQLPAAPSGGAQSPGAEGSIQPATLAAATQGAAPAVLDSERERLLRTARLAYDAQHPPERPPLVPDAGSEPPPAPPRPRQSVEAAVTSDESVQSAASASPATGSSDASTGDAAEAAIPAPPKS